MIKVFLSTAFQPHHRNLVSSLINTNIRYISLLEQYEQRVATGAIVNDLEQRNVIFCLNELLKKITKWYSSFAPFPSNFSQKQSFFSTLLKRISSIFPFRRKITSPKGMYIYGDVGCGKTFMMDLFFESCPVREKSRMHFHVFMRYIHLRLHELKQSNFQGDALVELSNSLIAESNILCLDEFQVPYLPQRKITDISDAMILTRLFKELFKRPFILITTSNRAPERLYENGLQRESFLPCIELIKANCNVFSMNSGSDYRRSSLGDPSRTYFYPINESNADHFEGLFLDYIGTNRMEPQVLTVFGRRWIISNSAGHVAKFTFSNICEESLGPADYVELAKKFRCIFISNIPKLTVTAKDEARRFISLIDALYEHNVVLFCLAECHFKDLFDFGTSGSRNGSQEKNQMASGTSEVLAFKRTISRLYEMNSPKWLANLHPPETPTEVELKK